jgi:hypothetical protein
LRFFTLREEAMAEGEKRLIIWWAILVGLTLLSFEGASGFAFLSDPAVSISLIIVIAMLKVRIVILNFMEVAHAPLVLRVAPKYFSNQTPSS